jgi:hypothetical protein
MANLKERLKDKVDWKHVDLALVGYFFLFPGDQKGKSKFLKGKRLVSPLANPKVNVWKTDNSFSISADRLIATNNVTGWRSVSADKGFIISVDFSGPVMYYFELTITMMSSLLR